MREVAAELKDLRLYGMSGAWDDLVAQGNSAGLQSARWLVEHLLDVEHTDRAMLPRVPAPPGNQYHPFGGLPAAAGIPILTGPKAY
jgi:hypothetical protein